MSKQKYYGVIFNGELSLRGPRAIDSDETPSIRQAFLDAADGFLDDGNESAEIVVCKYYGEDGNGYWGEDYDYPVITIDAEDAEWLREPEEDEE